MRRHGRGAFIGMPCQDCTADDCTADESAAKRDNTPNFRCTECANGRLVCRRCLLRAHAHMPLHVVEARPTNAPSLPYAERGSRNGRRVASLSDLFVISARSSSSATRLVTPASILKLDTLTSWLCTQLAFTEYGCITANVTVHCRLANSSWTSAGGPLPLIARKRAPRCKCSASSSTSRSNRA